MISLVVALAAVARGPAAAQQEMCWEMKHGYNAVKGMLRAPKTEKRPNVFYFGEAETMEVCRAQCEKEPECVAFTWMGKSSKGGGGWLGGGNNKWTQQCYGHLLALIHI